MIKLEQSEANTFNILAEKGQALQQALAQVQEAQRSYIKLLELKYSVVFDEKTGQFEPKPKVVKAK